MGVFGKKKDKKEKETGEPSPAPSTNADGPRSRSPSNVAAAVPLPDSPIKQGATLTATNAEVPVKSSKSDKKEDKKATKSGGGDVSITVPTPADAYGADDPKHPMPTKPRNRCCCLFHMPTSIVLMIVLLLFNDVWFAWHSMNQRGQATEIFESMRTSWQQSGATATMADFFRLRTILDANVIVALVDMVFTLIGLAGVDTESFKLFVVFTFWKAAQFCYSVSTSIVTLTIMEHLKGEANGTDKAKKLLNWETGVSFAGLVLELYFFIFLCIFTHYLRKLNNWKAETGRTT
ncbi:hypothetical protein BCR44DRAFT_55196 [Catenaria anguillulae PL171]|uniref:Uncharacterized protein n=1 Tax=Catenaria anguillulae PL171 TaxID=765915 RepID=A0A1Y2HIF3_9FUNG|nr:hypothetical protein BCR44DRAFT_55196 [Catenaria anguillulae PL171]